MNPFVVEPVAVVRSTRTEAVDDHWDAERTQIELVAPWGPESLEGLSEFSHVVVVYLFHLVDPLRPLAQRRHLRGRSDWPEVGIFAQRARDRPNRIGVSTARIIGIDGSTVHVSGLDAVDGTPVLDLKPYLPGFDARGPIRQPGWSIELMRDYF